MDIMTILEKASTREASDIFIIAGLPISYRIHGQLIHDSDKMTPQNTEEIISGIYQLADNRDMTSFIEGGDDDFSFSIKGMSRFRVSAYKQRGSLAAVVRIITFNLPNPSDLRIPGNIIEMGHLNKGLILVTGPAGSGKSTTLACIVDEINTSQERHIMTLEDPLEFLHMHQRSIVSQREINTDTESYVTALRATLRQSPDVILLGEMRDYETINVAMTAAETGHLIISTLHTIGAANTIDRIIDVFPPNQQRQIAVQLSMCLRAVITQQLIPTVNNQLVPAFEIMTVNSAIRNMIREHKIPQIEGMIYSSSLPEMISMDASLLQLCQEGRITKETALAYSTNPEMLGRKL